MPNKRSKKEKAQPLSIFLLNKPVKEIVSEMRLKLAGFAEERRVAIDGHEHGILFAANFRSKEPSWLKFFKGSLDKELDISNKGSGAVLLIQQKDNPFALCFGYGKSLLPKDCWHENFGLIATLNSVDPEKIRQVDHLSLDDIGRHTKIQTGQASPINELGIDFDQELIKEVVGTPDKDEFGKRLSGTDQVKLTPKTSINGLPDILKGLSEKYKEKTYLKNFPWIGRLEEVKNLARIEKLNDEMIDRLKKGDLTRTWMAVPEVIEWNEIGWFSYRGITSEDRFEDIYLSRFLETVNDKSSLSVDYLKGRRVLAIALDSEEVRHDWQALKCLYSEIDGKDETYVFTNSTWYKIHKDFTSEMADFMKGVQYDDSTYPIYTDANEGEYNKRICDENKNFFCADKKNITLKGQTPIEFCDVYTKSKKIIHVKRYRGSSGLSHLFMQGGNSATLFFSEEKFREEVNGILPMSHKIEDVGRKPKPGEFTIVFAIISSADISTKKLDLPFFSRITLRKVFKELNNYGYSVKLAKIYNTKAKLT